MVKIFKIILCLLLFVLCCSKGGSDGKTYKTVICYVFSKYLSGKSDIPFVDKVKYDYNLNEFAYDREKAINWAKKDMIKYNKIREPLSDEYYIDDPQIYSFYGKNCEGGDEKYIVLIMLSKQHEKFNRYIVLTVDNENEYDWSGSGKVSYDRDSLTIKDFIASIRGDGNCP